MYMKTDKELLQDFTTTRNLKPTTIESYTIFIKNYTKQQQKTMVELIEEAENEEEQGIRWKHRTLKKRLIQYRTYLYQHYMSSTAKMMFSKILTIYKHYEIEIHDLPKLSVKKGHQNPPITFNDLPDKEIIKKALDISKPRMRAIILFISSSGCGRSETVNLTIQDFINATSDYHHNTEIYNVLNELKDKQDIIPRWELCRNKTNKFYTTFTSPEATSELINYLISSNRTLQNTDKLFGVGIKYLNRLFRETNDKLGLGKKGSYIRLRPHMLRKYHASQLFNDGCSIEFVDALQGRGKDTTHSSYFMEDPKKLRKQYINHLDCLMINWNNITYKSPEYMDLEQKYQAKKDEVQMIHDRIQTIEKILFSNDPDLRNVLDDV